MAFDPSGVHFDTSSSSLINEIATAVKVFAYGVESYVSEPSNARHPLGTRLSCGGVGAAAGEARWSTGERSDYTTTVHNYTLVSVSRSITPDSKETGEVGQMLWKKLFFKLIISFVRKIV